jgi:putative nucleotidyltransferase with HDIG domain
MQLTGSERATLEQITRTIRQDQALAVRILRMANSAAFNRGDPVESIEKAAQRLGLAQIRQVAINVGVVDQMSEIAIGGRVDAAQFWEHSIATGLIASKIARARAPEDADHAFTMGLMHDVGRVLFAEDFPEEYAEAMRVTDELGLPLEQVETRLFMASHADCMDRLLHQWRFPKELIDPIVFHHLSPADIRRVAPRRVQDVSTLALANRVAHALLLGSSGNDVLYPTEELCEVLGVDDRMFGRMEDETRRETEGIRLSMLASGGGARGWVDRVDAVRKALHPGVRPLYISRRPGIDAFRSFFDQVRQDGVEAPNLMVVHVADAREVDEVTAMARCVECTSDVSGLPVLVLSSAGGEIDLRGRLDDRRVEIRRAPIAVSHLLHAMNELLAPESGKAAA